MLVEQVVLVVRVGHRGHLVRRPLVEGVAGVHREVVVVEGVPSLVVVEVGVVPELLGWTVVRRCCGLSSCCLVPAFGGQPIAFGLD